jgi:predicted RNase H-like HicB family nuclease
MSTDTGTRNNSPTTVRIILTHDPGSDWWRVKDEETGVATQGKTRQEALANLDEALAGYHGAGEPPTDAELREAGIDPANNTSGSLADSELFEE